MKEIQFDLVENSDLESYGVLNAIDYFIRTKLDEDAKKYIRVYLKYTAHDNLPYTESKITLLQLNDNKYVFLNYVSIIQNEFQNYLK